MFSLRGPRWASRTLHADYVGCGSCPGRVGKLSADVAAVGAHGWEYSDGNDSSCASALSGAFCAVSVMASTCGSCFSLHRSAKSIPRRSSSACVLTYTPRYLSVAIKRSSHCTHVYSPPRSYHGRLNGGMSCPCSTEVEQLRAHVPALFETCGSGRHQRTGAVSSSGQHRLIFLHTARGASKRRSGPRASRWRGCSHGRGP